MVIGHLSVAYSLRGRQTTQREFAGLVMLAFLPDIPKNVLLLFTDIDTANLWTHSIVAVVVMAVAAGAVVATTRSGSAGLVAGLAVATHWPLDLITGQKPTWPHGPTIGLNLYEHPRADIAI